MFIYFFSGVEFYPYLSCYIEVKDTWECIQSLVKPGPKPNDGVILKTEHFFTFVNIFYVLNLNE